MSVRPTHPPDSGSSGRTDEGETRVQKTLVGEYRRSREIPGQGVTFEPALFFAMFVPPMLWYLLQIFSIVPDLATIVFEFTA